MMRIDKYTQRVIDEVLDPVCRPGSLSVIQMMDAIHELSKRVKFLESELDGVGTLR